MSAVEESSIDIQEIRTLGVIAGGGTLPEKLLHACDRKKIEPFVVGFEGQTDPALVEGRRHLWTRLGAAGQIIHTLKAHQIRDLVLIGSMHRPSISELRPDLRTAQFFAKLGIRALGDDGILGAIRKELEHEGFTIHGVQDFADDLLAGLGPVGKCRPGKAEQVDIQRGIEVSQALGGLDVGQSVIVQEGLVLAIEAIEGTDAMIRRCADLKRKGRGGVLVKTCKPQQDRNLDLPTIGPETVRLCAKAGLSGIAVQAGNSLILEPQIVSELADQKKIFVVGVEV